MGLNVNGTSFINICTFILTPATLLFSSLQVFEGPGTSDIVLATEYILVLVYRNIPFSLTPGEPFNLVEMYVEQTHS